MSFYDDYGDVTVDDYEDFDGLLGLALAATEYLTEIEKGFVLDMADKFDLYGYDTYCSPAQYRWLKILSMRRAPKKTKPVRSR